MSDQLVAPCPECGAKIRFQSQPYLGDNIVCPECSEKLEVVGLNPLELDWLYMDYEEEDWDDDDDDDSDDFDDFDDDDDDYDDEDEM